MGRAPAVTDSIRRASPGDAELLVPLFEQLGYPTSADEIRARLQAASEHSTVLLATRGSRAIGFAAVEVTEDLIVGRRGVVLGLVVDESARSGGVGARLLDDAERWAFARGAVAMMVRSNVIRERAHGFYERKGYRRVKSQHVFEKRRT